MLGCLISCEEVVWCVKNDSLEVMTSESYLDRWVGLGRGKRMNKRNGSFNSFSHEYYYPVTTAMP